MNEVAKIQQHRLKETLKCDRRPVLFTTWAGCLLFYYCVTLKCSLFVTSDCVLRHNTYSKNHLPY